MVSLSNTKKKKKMIEQIYTKELRLILNKADSSNTQTPYLNLSVCNDIII